jgi:hypothetical protein
MMRYIVKAKYSDPMLETEFSRDLEASLSLVGAKFMGRSPTGRSIVFERY